METTNPPLHLSQRVRNLKPSATLAVSALVRRLQAEGRDVIGFGAGEPDFDTPEHIQQAAIDALRCGTTHYMPVPGEPKARQTIADKLRDENGIACTPDDVVITVGAKHALYLALQCLLDAGDDREVIVPTPAWVSYQPMIELSGGNVVEVPGALDNDYKITPAQLEAAITPRTAVLMINSPSNPCGTMYEPDELRALAEVVEPRGQITILTDEIYEKLVYGGTEHFSPGSIGAIADRVVTVNGLSKAYAMTGWRIGYACAPGQGPGDLSLAKAMAKLQGQMTSHITSFCYAAIVEALTNGAASVEQMRRAFADRARLMYERVKAMPGIRCPRPTGAFYVFPDISAHVGKQTPAGRAIDSSSAFAEALVEEAGVGVVPGAAFGDAGEGHVRLSFACSTEQIEEGCRRLVEWLRTLR
jgi:aspartate aminotransferase